MEPPLFLCLYVGVILDYLAVTSTPHLSFPPCRSEPAKTRRTRCGSHIQHRRSTTRTAVPILGTPTREEIKCMNPNYTEFKFPQIKAHPWHKIFKKNMPPEATDLVSRLLQYSPKLRCTALEACTHPFFDDLRDPTTTLPDGKPLPPLFNFTPQEIAHASPELIQRLIPEHARRQTK